MPIPIYIEFEFVSVYNIWAANNNATITWVNAKIEKREKVYEKIKQKKY
ncbi:hypothetical protein [Plasmodium yoelii yoelii]|uniref:Uncharacterized protein n=1 Tax=Plasmodium yoelii yoelii TaxID=73239 RepID=Q7RP71_PLAYO|nr:hypothetical protein [Plasmodium yoelii yoelii]